jgi:hypothetical protein
MAQSIAFTDHPRGLTLRTPQEFKAWGAAWTQAFPDGQKIDVSYLDAGDAVVDVARVVKEDEGGSEESAAGDQVTPTAALE